LPLRHPFRLRGGEELLQPTLEQIALAGLFFIPRLRGLFKLAQGGAGLAANRGGLLVNAAQR